MQPIRYVRSRILKRLVLLLALLAALATADGFWIEPRLLLTRDRVAVDLVPGAFRVVHLSDLHIERETALYRRLLRRIAAERPDLVLVSGDFVADVHYEAKLREQARAAAGWVAQLRRQAPILAVQGHSDYFGDVVSILAGAGVEWLSNEGRRIGPDRSDGGALLLGLGQYSGRNVTDPEPEVFAPLALGGETVLGARPGGRGDHYLSYDPLPPRADPSRNLARASGPLAWSGYEAVVSVRVDQEWTGAGLALHSRYVLGEDRLVRLARARGTAARSAVVGAADPGTFALSFNGTAATAGEADTGIAPEPGRWYRLRARTEVERGRVVVRGRVWPEGEAEPAAWQAWLEDRSPYRLAAGTVGLWAFGEGGGEGTAAFRDLRVADAAGRVLLEESFAGGDLPDGFREGARATRLVLALARSPQVPAGTPRIVLTHSPDAVEEAARRGIALVLAGHTHGGQVALPFYGAIITLSRLGKQLEYGLYRVDKTSLYVTRGVGMEGGLAPRVRFWAWPEIAVIDVM
ncbi:MAG TPA: metallophosphoesterase [Thermoanaerobaculia bacterium]|nr:metallophosphoesterase [Thermoanaerobaculia bacterium]